MERLRGYWNWPVKSRELLKRHLQGLLDSAKEISSRRPHRTPGAFVNTAFSTLKRGANKRCASGAAQDITYPAINKA
jgi:hypothetical protein